MPKFQFRLATLQKIREAHRDKMRTRLAEAYHAEELLAEQIATLRSESNELLLSQRVLLQGATADVNQLLDTQRYQAVLHSQLATMNDQSQLLAAEVEKRRKQLVEADQQVRVLDKLYQRQLDVHRSKELQNEIKVMDEIASRSREVRQ